MLSSRGKGFQLAVALGVAVTAACRPQPPGDPVAALLATVPCTAGHLTGAPWLATTGAGVHPRTDAALRAASLSARRALDRNENASTLRRDAVVALLANDAERAVTELMRAAAKEPGNGQVWSDLAAAHLQRGVQAADPYEVVLALSASGKAVELQPGSATAHFNHALALEGLSLRGAALEEWRVVAAHETGRAWRAEAEAHAKRLSAPGPSAGWDAALRGVSGDGPNSEAAARAMAAASPQRSRELVEEVLLPRWAAAELARHPAEAEAALSPARRIAGRLAVHGDPLDADTVAQIDRLAAPDPAARRQIAVGLQRYRQALDRIERGAFSAAEGLLRRARQDLASARSPFAGWATFQSALCRYELSDYRQVRRLLDQEPVDSRYRALDGRRRRLIGLIEGIDGQMFGSLEDLSAAERNFLAIGEGVNAARLSAMVAAALGSLGKVDQAWRHLHSALLNSEVLERPENRYSICATAADLAQMENRSEAALLFQDEVVRIAAGLRRPEYLLGALRERASLLVAAGKPGDAARDLGRARVLLPTVADAITRQSIDGDLALAEGETFASTSPSLAVASLDRAIAVFRGTSYHYLLGRALFLRAMVNQRLGQSAAMERDLTAAIDELERQREAITTPEYRISYFDQRRDIFDAMIAFQLDSRHRPDAALAFSERARARVLLDWTLTEAPRGPHNPDIVKASPWDMPRSPSEKLPAGVTVVEYTVLPRWTGVWVLRRGQQVSTSRIDIGADALAELIAKYGRAVQRDQAIELAGESRRLYSLLIEPIEHLLAPGDQLIFVPDGALHTLAFATLLDPRRGRYLVQDHACSVAPSTRAVLTSAARDSALPKRDPLHVLAVTAPDFDGNLDPSLPPLRAGVLGPELMRLFPGSQELRQAAATRREFLRLAGDFDILHFGGHSRTNEDRPLLSQLIFARDAADPSRGVLTAGEVLQQRLPRSRLVVLASCATGRGRISRTEGVENLARSFLAIGIPAVVASLWRVDDAWTDDFLSVFYRRLGQGLDVARALQAAQISSIARGSGQTAPRDWGAFEVIGYSAGVAADRPAVRPAGPRDAAAAGQAPLTPPPSPAPLPPP